MTPGNAYQVTTKGNILAAERCLDPHAVEVERFRDRDDAFLYAALSKQKWATVEVHRITGGVLELLLRFHHGVKEYKDGVDLSPGD